MRQYDKVLAVDALRIPIVEVGWGVGEEGPKKLRKRVKFSRVSSRSRWCHAAVVVLLLMGTAPASFGQWVMSDDVSLLFLVGLLPFGLRNLFRTIQLFIGLKHMSSECTTDVVVC